MKQFLAIILSFCLSSYYPNFDDHPFLTREMKSQIKPYLFPLDHPLKPLIDLIFSQGRVTATRQSMLDAGFSVIDVPSLSGAVVSRHPLIPGLIFKIYPDTLRESKKVPSWHWLIQRCHGASKIRRYIQKKGIQNFVVPDKWLYILPAPSKCSHPVILICTDMQLESIDMTKYAWKHLVTKQHLDELYSILKLGYGSTNFELNLPYTKSGKFAFIDLEKRKQKINYKKARKYLSEELKEYWTKMNR